MEPEKDAAARALALTPTFAEKPVLERPTVVLAADIDVSGNADDKKEKGWDIAANSTVGFFEKSTPVIVLEFAVQKNKTGDVFDIIMRVIGGELGESLDFLEWCECERVGTD